MKKKMVIIFIVVISIISIGLLKKFNRNDIGTKRVVESKINNSELRKKEVDLKEKGEFSTRGGLNSKEESNEVKLEETIESKIERYIEEKGKEYSNDIISGENSFFVGGIGKAIEGYDLDNFKPEDFDIYGLMSSVSEFCNKFEAEVIIDDEYITVNIYTEKDKFYEDE